MPDKATLEYWRWTFAKHLDFPISDEGDNLHWACVALGRIRVLESENAKLKQATIAELNALATWVRSTYVDVGDARDDIARAIQNRIRVLQAGDQK